jgi:hypothetical protein
MPPAKRKLPPVLRAYNLQKHKEREHRCELAADHLHATHDGAVAGGAPDGPLSMLVGVSDPTLHIDSQFCFDNRVVTRWSVYGTHSGPLAGYPASDREVSITGVSVSTLDGDVVVSQQSYWDVPGLLEQLDLVGG